MQNNKLLIKQIINFISSYHHHIFALFDSYYIDNAHNFTICAYILI